MLRVDHPVQAQSQEAAVAVFVSRETCLGHVSFLHGASRLAPSTMGDSDKWKVEGRNLFGCLHSTCTSCIINAAAK